MSAKAGGRGCQGAWQLVANISSRGRRGNMQKPPGASKWPSWKAAPNLGRLPYRVSSPPGVD
eukprot:5040686-Alexandrium_andersonii.AAC.1